MATKLNKTTETGIFDLMIEGDEFLKPPYDGPFRLKIEFVTTKPGEAVVLTVAHSFQCPDCFKWGDKLYDHIQKSAEIHSNYLWESIKQDQQILN